MIDLSDLLVVVPTRGAARVLVHELAILAEKRAGSGLIPPSIIMPERILLSDSDAVKAAGALEMTAAWMSVLKEMDEGLFAILFPRMFKNDPSWLIGVARSLERLRNQLGEAGLLAADVAVNTEACAEEPDRWAALAELEGKYLERLRSTGFEDPEALKKNAAHPDALLRGKRKMIVAAVPDPIPLTGERIRQIAMEFPVEVWIHAPEDASGRFDDLGRPLPSAWTWRDGEKAVVDIPDWERRVIVSGDLDDQAEEILRKAADDTGVIRSGRTAIVSANPNLLQLVDRALNQLGASAYDPSGKPLKSSAVHHLLDDLRNLVVEGDAESITAMLRNSSFLSWLEHARGVPRHELLISLDKVNMEYMPHDGASFAAAVTKAKDSNNHLLKAHAEISAILKEFSRPPLSDSLGGFLGKVYGDVDFKETLGPVALAAAEWVSDTLPRLGNPLFTKHLSSTEALSLVVDALGSQRAYVEKPDNSLDVNGWLETAWLPEPTLVVAGFNEGYLPASTHGDPFLPNSLRGRLGLSTNETRFVRDAYLLSAIIEGRRSEGSVHLIVGRHDKEQEPLKPSRLLYLCGDEELIRRVAYLYQERGDRAAPPSVIRRSDPWKPRVSPAAPPTRFRVTDFKRYLACPFRFYLSRMLEMEEVDYLKGELDAMEFGEVCHLALEALCRDPKLGISDNASIIGGFMTEFAVNHFTQQYGAELGLPLAIQLESVKQRLAKAAEVHAQAVADGWRVVDVEHKIGGGLGLPFEGLTISGRIDRIEINDRLGVLRIVDYKTGDKALDPVKDHFTKPKKADPSLEFAVTGGGARRWSNLQLPMYRHLLDADDMLKRTADGREIACAYFNLPKAVLETGITEWDDLDSLMPEAMEVAARVAERVRNGVFWPPAANVKFDPYETIFPTGLDEERIDSAAVTRVKA